MASTLGRAEVKLRRPAPRGTTGRHAAHLRFDCSHGARKSTLGLYAHSGSASQSQSQGWPRDDSQCVEGNDIEPAPERSRRTPWSTFLKAHQKVFAASDFLTVEVWTGKGLVTHYLLFLISLADRVVTIAGITTRPDEAWMLQMARNLTDAQSGALRAKRFLILDRDSKYSAQFRRVIGDS
jgi:hypothetical protein